jgi:hypothetical protein
MIVGFLLLISSSRGIRGGNKGTFSAIQAKLSMVFYKVPARRTQKKKPEVKFRVLFD